MVGNGPRDEEYSPIGLVAVGRGLIAGRKWGESGADVEGSR